jgi:predicted metallo-beta-lactamase superfamily hydrolase
MHDQLSLPLDRKLQNSLILSMKSAIEERIRQSSTAILQLLYTHFHHDHHEQQIQRRRSSTPLLELPSSILQTLKKPTDETNNSNTTNNNNSTVKVSALVAHYSGAESSSTVNVSINLY